MLKKSCWPAMPTLCFYHADKAWRYIVPSYKNYSYAFSFFYIPEHYSINKNLTSFLGPGETSKISRTSHAASINNGRCKVYSRCTVSWRKTRYTLLLVRARYVILLYICTLLQRNRATSSPSTQPAAAAGARRR